MTRLYYNRAKWIKLKQFKIGASFRKLKDGTIEYWIPEVRIRERN